jgi:broad specificity phosphatase PhoE
MARLYLVRHGRASAGWDVDPDPGLDELGVSQAAGAAEHLAPLGPMAMITSPLRRCRETAAPLAARWGVVPAVDEAVAEIPSPEGVAMGERTTWLRDAMAGTWDDLGPRYVDFAAGVARWALDRSEDTVVVSHFVAINAVIGAAIGDRRVVIRSLDNASITVVDVGAGRLTLVEGGHEADTLVR